MNSNKQLVNLGGILVVVVLLVAGFALVAMPMYTQAQTTDAQTRNVAQTNSIYEQQIARLSSAQSQIDDIDESLASMRKEIAAIPRLDDVHALIAAGAEDIDMRVESVSIDAAAPWIPRDALDGDGNAVLPEDIDSAADAEATADPAVEGEGTAEAEPAAEAPAEDADQTPQQQILVTITLDTLKPYAPTVEGEGENIEDETVIDVDGLSSIAKNLMTFVDALRKGPRLITPINIAYEDDKCIITVLTYLRTDGI